jgi:site-specific DNA recombinase
MNVVGYSRVSTEDQAREGVSIDSQIEKITAYCVAKDWDLLNVYVDEGVSAKTLSRPGIQEIITSLSRKAKADHVSIDAIIVYKLDRLTRSVVDLNRLLELFEKHDVALVSLVESLDATSAAGRLMLNLLASVSQWEREVIGERTRDAMAFLKAKKRVYSRPVFGYSFSFDDDNDGQLIEDEQEQRVIAAIQQLRREGLSYRAIVKKLNANNIPTKRGGRWQMNTVRQIFMRHDTA